MEQQQSSFKEKERIELREPRRFKVTIYNDDFTTMEFVVKVLTTVFYKSSVEAETLMLQVHKSNSAVVGIYSYDIAHSKVQKATRMARNEGFPLRLTVTPEEMVEIPGITVPNIRAVLCVQNKVLADRNKVRSGRLVEELLKEAGESRCGHE